MEQKNLVLIKNGPFNGLIGEVQGDPLPDRLSVKPLGFDHCIDIAKSSTEPWNGRSCQFCAHGNAYHVPASQWEPEDDEFSCPHDDQHEDELQELFELCQWAPCTVGQHCPFYKVLECKCVVCDKPLGPAHLWKHFVSEYFSGEPVPVCEEHEAQYRDEQEKVKKDIQGILKQEQYFYQL